MQTAAGNGNHDCADGIIEIVEDIKKLSEEFTLLEDKKSKLEMDETEDGEYSSGSVEFITKEAEKMELPQSKYVERNRLRRHNARPSPYQTPPVHPSKVYNLRSKHAQEKPEQPPKLTPRLKVEDVRRHITYKLNQEESKMVDRWRDHSFGRNGGDNASFGVASLQDSGLLDMDIQCLVYQGRRDLHKLWLNNNVVSLYGEILMKWTHSYYPYEEHTDFFISPYAGGTALASLNDRNELCWVKKVSKGYHNRLFLPCVVNKHYILVVADCLEQKVVVYDSMNSGKHKKDAVKVANWLKWVCATVLGYEDSESWDFIYPKDIPQQENGHDCGVFILTYMASILMCGSIVPFSTEEIRGIRHRVLIELLKGQLVGL